MFKSIPGLYATAFLSLVFSSLISASIAALISACPSCLAKSVEVNVGFAIAIGILSSGGLWSICFSYGLKVKPDENGNTYRLIRGAMIGVTVPWIVCILLAHTVALFSECKSACGPSSGGAAMGFVPVALFAWPLSFILSIAGMTVGWSLNSKKGR